MLRVGQISELEGFINEHSADDALVEHIEASAKLTMSEMKTLMLDWMTEQEAWQESR